MKRIKLFCIPYAGGSAMVYGTWKNFLDRRIVLHPVELPGRGKRINEPYCANIMESAEDVLKTIKYELLDGTPYAFFGHSLGSIIAYQTAQLIRERRMPEPAHIFFSGRGAPHILRSDKKPYYLLPDDEFKEKVLDLGGTPEEFFQHPELMEILLPLLKSDFKISGQYKHPEKITPLTCDISIMTGKEEDLKPGQVEGWEDHTTEKCILYHFEGGHFFLNHKKEKEQIMKILNETLTDIARKRIGMHV
ncbi:MAG: thioesterase [bacterium]|nr:thioesterase [bacterium]